ncbi:dna repair protein [Lichtheimia corymbifera JMRC:FSU:9682]|uniref:Dna repair protein n=1 Tax=Lichtheimia corymbifera JMRC:FSU:9682 TaxID=1263082 RepID=A0A068SEW7_9FUNG|nr:dna repair protein [Lichtheimia corymbifera JMRC:FSU:9682]
MDYDDDTGVIQQNRNYILATCTALGGYEEKETAPGVIKQVYTLGDQALGCLRDLKRAIRAESNASYKTFLPALADFNTLENDFIPIIKMHARDPSEIAERLILACLELIVPMTWPLQQRQQASKNDDSDDEDDEEYDPNLLLRYRRYKLALLQPGILEAVTRLLVDPLAIPYRERSMRDQIVIRLVLYFIRNLAAIPDLNVSQSAPEESLMMASMQEKMLLRFCDAGIIELLLVIASNSNEPDSAEWNVIVLEILYYLLQGVPVKDIFESDLKGKDKSASMISDKVSALLRAETERKRAQTRNAPTRHQRFGGTYAIKSWDGETRVSHKQDAAFAPLSDIMDSTKKPDRRGVKRKERDEGGHKAYTTTAAMCRVKEMAQSFLKNAFNPFYLSLIKDIEREDKKIMDKDFRRLFYTMRWFLEYLGYEHTHASREREKKALQKEKSQGIFNSDELYLPNGEQDTPSTEEQQPQQETENEEQLLFDHDRVATAMDLRAFLLCLRRLQTVMDEKNWAEVQVMADCFRQMLVTASTMAASPHEEFREVAEYILSNIYHEHSTLDLFVDMIRKYKNQSYGYLKSAVELTDIMLRLLEQYSSKNQFMFVRRKIRQKKKQDAPTNQGEDGDDSEEDEERETQVAYREHVFKFDAFEKKYLHYDVIRVYCILLEQLDTLEPHLVLCITNLFHRIMVKRKCEQIFYKLPVLNLFNQILGRQNTLPRNTAITELIRFIRYCTRQFFKRLESHPPLFLEILFTNPNSKRS